ncbi:trichohyalin-like [Toxorhynchites rutilus septentrionalis]|uniref:trichohyalin-like n=1 Tax=Toxorhynchites rutilus septentrionalis TaxID=329112 RepID=UPI0024793833|nr:trichohyalin-like [Toxorhynchites rutilus septentrionalis]
MGKRACQIFVKYFPEIQGGKGTSKAGAKQSNSEINRVIEEVRNEIGVLSETMKGNTLGEVKESQNENAVEAGNVSIESKESEIESSVRRSDEMMLYLKDFEEGKLENAASLVEIFKSFVVQTREQQKLMREKEIEAERKREREVKENRDRKKRLEKLLMNLNEQLRTNINTHTQNEPDRALKQTMSIKIESDEEELSNTDSVEGETEGRFEEIKKSDKRLEQMEKLACQKIKGMNLKKGNTFLSEKNNDRRHRENRYSSYSSSGTDSLDWDSSSTRSTSESSLDRKSKKNIKKGKQTFDKLKRIPVSEWRVKYDGKDQGRRVAEFLKEIELRRKSEKISERELFRGAIHLFTGRAKDWFMEGYENRDFRNWHELKRELKREFLPPDLNFQIEIQATNRRQARGEKFVDYFHDMIKLIQSMTRPMSERRKFEVIWRNMRFDYKNAMIGAGIRSLPKLKKYGRMVDENYWNIYQKPTENQYR